MKFKIGFAGILLGYLFSVGTVFSQNYIRNIQPSDSSYILVTSTGKYIKINILSENLIRIRFSDDNSFNPSLMERYEIVNRNWLDFASEYQSNEKRDVITFGGKQIHISKATGAINVLGIGGDTICKNINFLDSDRDITVLQNCENHFNSRFESKKVIENIVGDEKFEKQIVEDVPSNTAKEFGFSVDINPKDRFYGFGSAVRGQIQHRGSAVKVWADYQKSEAPVPFVMNTGGWAIFCNTTFVNYWDIDNFRKDKMVVWGPEGETDIYLIIEDTMPEMLSTYTSITGHPYLLPRWAYGLTFGGSMMEDQFDVLDNAVKFRNEQIPCDIYSLEPQWMAKNYDFSTGKKWDYNKFRPFWPEFKLDNWVLPGFTKEQLLREHLFVRRLENIGFKVALWLCIDTDLSVQEEDRIAKLQGKPLSGKEHWFDHLTQFMDDGVKGFKLDPGRTLNEHPNRIYFNGKTDREMHNMQQVLLQKQMKLTYQNHTGERSYHHYCGGYAGSQHWGAMTTGDNGGGKIAMHDMLNLSMSGFSNISSDVLEQVVPMSGAIHFGFFQPWVMVNSWAEIFHPWYFTPDEKKMFKEYAELRYKLIPYIYSYALNASLTGIPIIRTMPLVFPNDVRLENSMNQFMFGDYFLVGAYTNSIDLPEGSWIDFWTGKKYEGNTTINNQIPKDKGGQLFVKTGAIVPMRTKSQFITELPEDTLIVRVYPDSEKETSFKLLEDDGISYGYESNNFSLTDIICKPDKGALSLTVSDSKGHFNGQKEERIIVFEVYMGKAKNVWLNDKKLKRNQWQYDSNNGSLKLITGMNIKERLELRIR